MDEFEALHIAGHGEIPAILPPPPQWTRYAACADMDVSSFYPDRQGAKEAVGVARDVCRRCPVRQACLQHALDHNEVGIWAGTTEEQRRQMRRQEAA